MLLKIMLTINILAMGLVYSGCSFNRETVFDIGRYRWESKQMCRDTYSGKYVKQTKCIGE